jgi:hypothetical protein
LNPRVSSLTAIFALFGLSFCLLGALQTAEAYGQSQVVDKKEAALNATPGLQGDWKFNAAKSDDPAKKLVVNDDVFTGDAATSVPVVGQMGGVPNGAQNGASTAPPPGAMGAPGGMSGVGGLNQAPVSVPQMPATHRWETDKERQKRLAEFMPADSLTVQQKDNEFDFIEGDSRKLALYTDGRKLRKSKDDKLQEFDARLDGERLSYDEKRPPRGTITRSFEPSADGRQMLETLEIDNGTFAVPVILKYVYDVAPAGARR